MEVAQARGVGGVGRQLTNLGLHLEHEFGGLTDVSGGGADGLDLAVDVVERHGSIAQGDSHTGGLQACFDVAVGAHDDEIRLEGQNRLEVGLPTGKVSHRGALGEVRVVINGDDTVPCADGVDDLGTRRIDRDDAFRNCRICLVVGHRVLGLVGVIFAVGGCRRRCRGRRRVDPGGGVVVIIAAGSSKQREHSQKRDELGAHRHGGFLLWLELVGHERQRTTLSGAPSRTSLPFLEGWFVDVHRQATGLVHPRERGITVAGQFRDLTGIRCWRTSAV